MAETTNEIEEPKTVYVRALPAVTEQYRQFSTKSASTVDRQLKDLEKFKSSSFYEAMKAEILSQAATEEVATSLEDLSEVSRYLDVYATSVSQAKEAQRELTLALLSRGEDLDAVKEAVGNSTSWLTIESWAGKFTGIGKEKKFEYWKVDPELGEAIHAKVEEAKQSS